ncbi:MAG: ATP-binding protein [Myxococcota bacterium]
MPGLRAIYAERYRCFYERTALELRPLTLLYGRNNVGKSALLRLLPLLSASVEDRSTVPLDLGHPAARGVSMPGLLWRGPTAADAKTGMDLAIEWDSSAKVRRVEYQIDFNREHGWAYVRRFRAWRDPASEAVEPEFDASRVPTHEDVKPTRLQYQLRGRTEPVELPVAGLRPVPGAHRFPLLEEIAAQLSELRGAVQWIQALRSAPPRLLPIRGGAPHVLEPDGSDALHLLQSDKELQTEVSQWYERELGCRLELRSAGSTEFRSVLVPVARSQLDVDLADAGEGMAQVLPLIVALARARRGGSVPRVVTIEEPESHLHPDAQRALAGLMLHAAAEDDPPYTVLETHSHAMLLAVQLGIARDPRLAEHVIAYWVHQLDDGRSRAEKITFSEHGQPQGNWPPNAFSDQRELARELVRLQLERLE